MDFHRSFGWERTATPCRDPLADTSGNRNSDPPALLLAFFGAGDPVRAAHFRAPSDPSSGDFLPLRWGPPVFPGRRSGAKTEPFRHVPYVLELLGLTAAAFGDAE